MISGRSVSTATIICSYMRYKGNGARKEERKKGVDRFTDCSSAWQNILIHIHGGVTKCIDEQLEEEFACIIKGTTL